LLPVLLKQRAQLLPDLIPEFERRPPRPWNRLDRSTRVFLVLLCALEKPTGAPEVMRAIRRTQDVFVHELLRGMSHPPITRKLLRQLVQDGALVRLERGRRVLYRLAPKTRRNLKATISELVANGVVDVVAGPDVRP
jgi:DNA-binding transcriptional ArsR family regulator